MPGEERLLLFSRARSGEEEAFAEIVTAYENFVYRIAIGITGQKEDAEDVTQETFLRLWQILDEFVWIDQPDAYIARMAKNAAIDLVRRRNRRQTQPFVGEDGEADAFAWECAGCGGSLRRTPTRTGECHCATEKAAP